MFWAYPCSVSSLAWFMSNQETSFVTLGQRVLAYPLKWVVIFLYLWNEKDILIKFLRIMIKICPLPLFLWQEKNYYFLLKKRSLAPYLGGYYEILNKFSGGDIHQIQSWGRDRFKVAYLSYSCYTLLEICFKHILTWGGEDEIDIFRSFSFLWFVGHDDRNLMITDFYWDGKGPCWDLN